MTPICSASREAPAAPGGDGPSLVALGGGTGLSVLLRGLKRLIGAPGSPTGSPRLGSLDAVVTVTDDGGSSGRLRRELGVLPPGDVRNCIVALAEEEDLLARLFQYRFPDGGGLTGHSFGNLFLTALTGITGDFYQAILTAEAILSVRGRILPATLTDVRLRGRGRSGRVYEGESAIGTSGEPMERLAIEPSNPPAFPAAAAAIRHADLIAIGPGSLYTSLVPNLLIPGIRHAVADNRAPRVLLLNLMTQPGETDGMDAADHLRALTRHAAEGDDHLRVDVALANSTPLPADLLSYYAESGSQPVTVDRDAFAAAGVRLVEADLLDTEAAANGLIRHDSNKLAATVAGLLGSERNRGAARRPGPRAVAPGG